MSTSLSKEDLNHCSLIIERGMYFYTKLKSINTEKVNNHEICTIAYFVRSIAEITVAMELWFKCNKNIKALGDASLIDNAHLLVKLTKEKDTISLNQFDIEVLKHGQDKYNAIYYPNGKCQLSQFRKKDDLFNNTLSITSKIIHQDEFSILGLPEFFDFKKMEIHILKLSSFWIKDFKNRICLTNNNFPEIIQYYECNHKKLPFKYNKLTI